MFQSPSITAIGIAARAFGQLPQRIEATAAELDIKPACRINNVPHYADDDLQRIWEHLAGTREEGK
jgi:hypothetical protein